MAYCLPNNPKVGSFLYHMRAKGMPQAVDTGTMDSCLVKIEDLRMGWIACYGHDSPAAIWADTAPLKRLEQTGINVRFAVRGVRFHGGVVICHNALSIPKQT